MLLFVGKYKGGRIWQHMAKKHEHGAFACEVCQLVFKALKGIFPRATKLKIELAADLLAFVAESRPQIGTVQWK